VSIPHDIEKRRVTTGTDPEPDPQVNGLIPLPPQVTGSARPNLSRWRHGFKSRWDYERKVPGQGTGAGSTDWLNRGSNAEHPESIPSQIVPGRSRQRRPA
jgi:hypothetical protein